MIKENINNEINEFRIFSILYKTLYKNKKPLIINFVFITIFYIIYLFLSGSFSTVYKVSQDLFIFKRLRKFEISSNPSLIDQSCLIFDTKSVYHFAKSNQFLNSFFSQIETKYPRKIDTINQNLKIGPFFKDKEITFFSINIVDENKNIARSIINDYSVILNKSLIEQNNQCNLVNLNNQSFNFKSWQNYANTKNKSISSEFIYSLLDLPLIGTEDTYFVEIPTSNNLNEVFRESNNINLKKSLIIYFLFLIGPYIYILYFLLSKGKILDKEGFKKLMSYKFLGTFDKKDTKYNSLLIENNISYLKSSSEDKTLGIIFLWGNGKKTFEKLFQFNNQNTKFIEVDYTNEEIINKIDNLIVVVQKFKTSKFDINKSRIYLDKFSEKVIGYLIYQN